MGILAVLSDEDIQRVVDVRDLGHSSEVHRGYEVQQQDWEVPELGRGKYEQGGGVQGTPEVKAASGQREQGILLVLLEEEPWNPPSMKVKKEKCP